MGSADDGYAVATAWVRRTDDATMDLCPPL
jgi:hypothetical protein